MTLTAGLFSQIWPMLCFVAFVIMISSKKNKKSTFGSPLTTKYIVVHVDSLWFVPLQQEFNLVGLPQCLCSLSIKSSCKTLWASDEANSEVTKQQDQFLAATIELSRNIEFSPVLQKNYRKLSSVTGVQWQTHYCQISALCDSMWINGLSSS